MRALEKLQPDTVGGIGRGRRNAAPGRAIADRDDMVGDPCEIAHPILHRPAGKAVPFAGARWAPARPSPRTPARRARCSPATSACSMARKFSPSSMPSEGCHSSLMPKSVTRSQTLGSSALRNDIVLPEHAPPCSQRRFATSLLAGQGIVLRLSSVSVRFLKKPRSIAGSVRHRIAPAKQSTPGAGVETADQACHFAGGQRLADEIALDLGALLGLQEDRAAAPFRRLPPWR